MTTPAEGPATVTHRCPLGDDGIMPCCRRTPFDVPRTDRMTEDDAAVTCAEGPATVTPRTETAAENVTWRKRRATERLTEWAECEQVIANVRAALPAGPRPHVDLYSIGRWDMAETVRALLSAAPTGQQS